jgi:hypothetical protein|tara:strand:+ start:751 stop:906 length:156 start_codon:yes stop_codon:yes gene_type:complete
MKQYNFFTKLDKKKESITTIGAPTRYQAALFFAKQKKLKLKEFLKIYGVSR